MTKATRERKTVTKEVSRLGEPVRQASRRRRHSNPDYAAEAARLAPYEAIARLVIKYRLEHDLTQKELADKIGTSHSAISRLESGQAVITLKTMKRIAEALGGRLVVGFELESDEKKPVREFVAV
jgi:ribosome-binding protein aMBF1 (putative translation factor)